MRKTEQRLPDTPSRPVPWDIIRRQEEERRRPEEDRRPHAPPPEPPGRYEDDPRHTPPPQRAPERGTADINFEIKGEEKDE